MDIQPQTTQPISDDQELAKVLAGVNGSGDDTSDSTPAMSDISAPVAAGAPPVAVEEPVAAPEVLAVPDVPTPEFIQTPAPVAPVASGELDGVKLDAINELRPLVDKLNLSPEEKFDTYLLLIRSTDDKALVAPAHEAAKAIADETRRAQALLDIIKEIDFLSQAK
jgi:hypothetical protein